MTKTIDAYKTGVSADPTTDSEGAPEIGIIDGVSRHAYGAKNIAEVVEIDETSWRSGGQAATGAVIGGLLTGGIGALAGAAIGGRKQSRAAFATRFDDGKWIAFVTSKKSVIDALRRHAKGKLPH